jgi:hypothetical protein
MKLFVTTCFILLVSVSYALPFQAPTPGNYSCFSSEESIFDENARDIGATLTINADNSYTFTTSNASENGSVVISEDTSAELTDYFQNGSILKLQPSSGSAAYDGMFVSDKQNGMYIMLKNNNGLNIRCQSPGADIAKAMNQLATEQAPTMQPTEPSGTATKAQEPTSQGATTGTLFAEIPSENETITSDPLQPLQEVQSGAYACSYTNNTVFFTSSDDPSYYPDEEIDTYGLWLLPDGSTLTTYLGFLQKYSDGSTSFSERNAGFISEYAPGFYTFEASTGQITLQGGNLGGHTYTYGTNREGKAALSRISTTREQGGTDKTWVNTYSCTYESDIPAGLTELADSTPVVDLTNITIAPSKFDTNNPNPNSIPITDRYYCYPQFDYLDYLANRYDDYGYDYLGTLPRYVREYVLEILPNNEYKFNGETGTFATGVDQYYLQWQSGPLNPTGETIKGEDDYTPPHSSNVSYDTWGAEITNIEIPLEDDTPTVDCFQQGAREQKALLDFALRQPTPAIYQCQTADEKSEQKTLEILPGNRYLFDGQEGSYWIKVRDLRNHVMWEFGPLWGDESYFSSDDSTGLRTLEVAYQASVGSGTSVSFFDEPLMFCESLAAANLIPVYGTAPATPPPAGSSGLDALYARADEETGWNFYHFLASGYAGQRLVTKDECSKTYPNGQNVCGTYTAQGNTVTFGDGGKIALQSADSSNDDVIIEGQLYENKTLSGPLTLNGTFETGSASSSSPITNMSSTYISESSYSFSQDGAFSYSSSSKSTMAAPDLFDATGVGALATSSSFESSSGTYSIDGNTITFHHEKGYTTQCGFFFPRNNDTSSVHVCGRDYGLSE